MVVIFDLTFIEMFTYDFWASNFLLFSSILIIQELNNFIAPTELGLNTTAGTESGLNTTVGTELGLNTTVGTESVWILL